MEFNDKVPIYLQLMELFRSWLLQGHWQLGQNVPAVRELAMELGVNPNTVQRALSELEREGLIQTNRTSGRTVSMDHSQLDRLRQSVLVHQVHQLVEVVKPMGFEQAQVIETIEKEWKS